MSDAPDILDGENPFESLSGRDLTVLRLIVRQEVKAGVEEALEGSTRDLARRQSALELTVCGSPDSDSGGLIGRVRALETKATLGQWMAGMALGSSLAATLGLVVALLTHQVRL